MTSPVHKLSVGIAIACYKSNPSAFTLAQRIVEEMWPFNLIFIIDSEGLPDAPNRYLRPSLQQIIKYKNHKTNLGSAGNLQARIKFARECSLDFILAVNHDSLITRSAYETLLKYASQKNIGALYSLHHINKSKPAYDITGTRAYPFCALTISQPPHEELTPVYWSSSNNALYNIHALNRLPTSDWAKLWMCWEDLAIGHLLYCHKFSQWIVTKAVVKDAREFDTANLAGHRVAYQNKPIWYQYYDIRNYILIATLFDKGLFGRSWVWRVPATLIHSVLVEHGQRLQAIVYNLKGLLDGIRGKTGKWKLPNSS